VALNTKQTVLNSVGVALVLLIGLVIQPAPPLRGGLPTYIDMPLQHIPDPVLKRMKRATTRQKTLDLLARLRARLPGAWASTRSARP